MDSVAVHAHAMEGGAGSCGEAAPKDDDESGDDACADEGPEYVNATHSTAAVEEISRNKADYFRGGEEETGKCRTAEWDRRV